MEDHIRDLLRDGRYAGSGPSRFQYSEQLKETAVFRILFGGEDVSQVMDVCCPEIACLWVINCNITQKTKGSCPLPLAGSP